MELDIAENRHSAPGDWGGPEGGSISDAAFYRRQVRMGGREEMERDVRRQDFRWERSC